MSNKTKGESRVRTDFNVGGNTDVDKIKKTGAEAINLCNYLAPSRDLTQEEGAEFGRWKSLAMTAFEEATMWAVKAATI